MEIKNNNLQFKNSLTKRSKTDYLIIHHSASSKASVEDIHNIHLARGWSGIGYHFYITKNGLIYTGRPIDTIGAHTEGVNSQSIGICFEGNFEKEFMNNVQLRAGQELIAYIKSLYPDILVKKHKDFNSTACPGKNFLFKDLINQNEESKSMEQVYNTIRECPEWSQPYVKKAINIEILKGDVNGNLNLNDNKIFSLVIVLRAIKEME